ncbi:Dihydrofolate synthase/folylpolyglutamate synthase [Sphingomonas antarctica]|uniref:bifunctional folylpolyglutamate synthase/dihydrofolate synthase n=1 Tax=Sphingomonas antarctica TaxID=2040274 RepID=UPI0039E79C2C
MPDHARSDDAAVQAQLDRFAQLSPGRDILGLERITALLAALGDPQLRLPPVLHVAGTNGKGSTCAFLRSGLEAAGQTAHVFTSPHLVRFNERLRVAGRLIEDANLAPLLAEVLDAAEAQDIGPSFFEATTAAAFLAFSGTPADACVIEVGLGGRLDATNVVTPAVCGIASIGIDHQSFLGNTIAEIAAEKAGIAKPGVDVFCLDNAAVNAVIDDAIRARGGVPLIEGRDWQIDATLTPGLVGPHQLRNANLAAQILREFGIEDGAIRRGIASARWPGRLQRLADGPLTQGRTIWIDGAHNDDAARAVAQALAGMTPMHVVLGVLANKDAAGIVEALRGGAASLTFVPVPGHNHHDPQALAQRYSGRAVADLTAAVAPAQAGAAEGGRNLSQAPTLIAGSLYLCGEALRLNEEIPK